MAQIRLVFVPNEKFQKEPAPYTRPTDDELRERYEAFVARMASRKTREEEIAS